MNKIKAIAVILLAGAGLSPAASSLAVAQIDPFAVAAPRPAGRGTAPATGAITSPVAVTPAYAAGGQAGNRTGFTSVEQAVGASYVAAKPKGFASSAQIRALPKTVAPFESPLKPNNVKYLKGRPRIAVPSYVLGLTRQGGARASAAGAGSDITPRATSISTVLTGIDDELALKLTDEANADLIQRLTEAGFDVVPQADVQASKEIGRLQLLGDKVKGKDNVQVYGAHAAPLRTGHMLTSAVLGSSSANIVFNDVSVELDAVMLMPYMVIDYERIGGSGNSKYTGSASVEMETRFAVSASGAIFEYGAARGKGGGFGGTLLAERHGTDEAFGVLYEVDDKSDDVSVNNTFAQLGLGSLYRQSKYYAVEAVPERYAALVRAAYQGFNTALVAELKKAKA